MMTSDYPYGYIGFGDEKLQKGLDKDSGGPTAFDQ